MDIKSEILKYVKEQYGSEPEYLWAKFPEYSVLRHKSNRKWYAAVMNIPEEKIGLKGNKNIDIIDVKCDPVLVGSLRNNEGYFPAYHMNKANWITILLDGTVSYDEIIHWLDLSYELTKNKK